MPYSTYDVLLYTCIYIAKNTEMPLVVLHECMCVCVCVCVCVYV